ncbi:MAG: acylase [Gemmatimonadetes bacterium]|nr:acylase [Gemmatimonadota bacterium]
MKTSVLLLAIAGVSCAPGGASREDVTRWENQARDVTITRDDWGIAHIRGKTDADAVFGVMYAQAEDDFNRVETNYINSQGRLAEAEGAGEVWRDLRMKLFINPDSMKALYAESPDWLRRLMDSYADGLNYYLYRHPEVKPRVITRFEPWMALTFSEGSIGGDIERVNLTQLEAFYGKKPEPKLADETGMPPEPTGSNGIAIAPKNSGTGHSLLLINPHTSFFFREEAQMTSDEGLNAYGAITWGQFFVYQGFNERSGWMHTSSGVDNIDEYSETVTKKGDGYIYQYGKEERPVAASVITVPFRTDSGMRERQFTVYRTHHGPIVRQLDGKWISVRMMQEPVKALTQSYSRTKTKNLKEFSQVMELHTNSSNNTVYADGEGNIAYFHSNFIPKRDTRFDWTKPVDGANPATEWKGIHSLGETPNVFNPANGWVYNTNNWPYSAAGPNSPKQSTYPRYMQTGGENPRGIHAIRVLTGKKDFTVNSFITAAFDPYLTAFTDLVPALVKAYDQMPASNSLKKHLAEQVKTLRGWDLTWSATSVPTSLAVFWGEELWRRSSAPAQKAGVTVYEYMAKHATAKSRLEALDAAADTLEANFGTWKTPWGDINRFQRLTGDIVQPFNDSGPSIPVAFTSARWGSLASFGARAYKGTKKWYGTSGNSFVAVVEFGDSVRAKAVTAGGLNSKPSSKHFNDQAGRYSSGDLRDVYFYPNQLTGHAEREYRPGT